MGAECDLGAAARVLKSFWTTTGATNSAGCLGPAAGWISLVWLCCTPCSWSPYSSIVVLDDPQVRVSAAHG